MKVLAFEGKNWKLLVINASTLIKADSLAWSSPEHQSRQCTAGQQNKIIPN
jgi:hypothetical protein